MPEKIIKIVFLFFAVLIFLSILAYSPEKKVKVCFEQRCFLVEVANTPSERAQGLMNRKSLDKNSGMLFVFDKEDIYFFWMKNTLISLDMIWMKEDPSAGSGQVVFIKENAQPCINDNCSYIIPDAKAKYVLEINTGLVKEMGLKIGDNLDIN